MNKFKDFIDNFEERVITILLPLMVIVVFFSTFLRFTGITTISWGDELARYLMIWLIFLGIGQGAKNNKHFTVDVIVNLFPKSVNKALFVFRTAIIVAFLGIIIYLSSSLISSIASMGQTSPALQWPMWLIYSAIPVGSILMIIRSIQYTVKYLKGDTDADSDDLENI